MWTRVLILTFFLLSVLHSGACFYFLRHQTEIETLYEKGRDIQEDWPCNLPKETKIAVCKELLESHVFSEVLQLVYNESYELRGHEFKCERRPLWLVSKKYVKTERFRGFQQMIMCPVCSKYSKTCFTVNGVEEADREIFTRRTFNNDKRNINMSFEEMVESRETYDFESRQYFDANDQFITSQQTHYTDATERLTSMSSSVEIDSGQRRQKGLAGILGIAKYSGGSGSISGRRYNSGSRFDSSHHEVIPEEAPDDLEEIDLDQLVHAGQPNHSSNLKPLKSLHKAELEPNVDTKTSGAERAVDTESHIQADHPSNPVIQVSSSPNVDLEHSATERNLELPVHSPNEDERSDQIADLKNEILADKIAEMYPNTDIEHPVHDVYHDGAMKESISYPEIDRGQLEHADQHRDTKETDDSLKNVVPEEQFVRKIENERNIDTNQLVDVGQPKGAGEKSDLTINFDLEQKVHTTKPTLAEGSPEREQSQHSNHKEQLGADKEWDLQQIENFLEKSDSAHVDSQQNENVLKKVNTATVDPQQNENVIEKADSAHVDPQQNDNLLEKSHYANEDPLQYANPGEDLEEYYFSIDPSRPQSIFLYTWFKRGGYFTIYMHIIKLETSILKPSVSPPKVAEPFDMWKVPLHARPIQTYEPYDFSYEIEKNKVPKAVKKSNRFVEMTQFASGA